ncbi:putative RNA-directed DNA polymerase [Rosa chinensis]|uniref:Putative RNA-directed DNA polymerase n=1 Tax=Rosa chinensis TaxID=74649 RepID=A0A2P6QUE7_ROSCH|nr:putative RNA-directed DNA polymerase [Rosa chinensis]
MSSVSSTSFQVCLNGELSNEFKASRGIRQGDPLSPYLFVLCMEKLSHLIKSAVEDGLWKPVRASGSSPLISHLFFADDLILFAEASCDQARILKRCLDLFCDISGQEVNFSKSVLFCSPNTRKSLARNISQICGSVLTTNLGKYLGVPLIHTKITKQTYAAVVDKVQGRLAGWKGKLLNLAGRLTLIQSVSAAIPNYTMQTVRIPMSICDSLDKLNRDFLWGDYDGKKKTHLVSWELVCRPKEFGGLGIKCTKDMNQAMLAKIGWRMFQGDKGLWSDVLHHKYVKQVDFLHPQYSCPTRCSSTWRGVIFGSKLLHKGLSWRIGDGSSVNFWTDTWFHGKPLTLTFAPSSIPNFHAKVKDFWNEHGWNMDLLRSVLPDDLISQIVKIPAGYSGCGSDKLIWGATSTGKFSVKSAYLTLLQDENYTPFNWAFIWKMAIPPKLKSFFWLICHGKLLTNVERVKRRMSSDPSCPLCHNAPETIMHLLRDCSHASSIWNKIICLDTITRAMHLDWMSWLAANIRCQRTCYGELNWCVVFVFACWYIWKWRNKIIFDEEFHYPINPSNLIIDATKEWSSTTSKNLFLGQKATIMLHWTMPPLNWCKLNIDGARERSGKIGAGGVLRDSSGSWISGFTANLGCGSVIQAEAWGLLLGLRMSVTAHCQNIIIESDSDILVTLVNQEVDELHPLKSIINSCQYLMQKFVSCEVKHVFREINMVADMLSKCSLTEDLGVHFMEQPPPQVINLLLDDLCESPKFRTVVSHM